jgi:hypothetical protein
MALLKETTNREKKRDICKIELSATLNDVKKHLPVKTKHSYNITCGGVQETASISTPDNPPISRIARTCVFLLN